MSQTKLAEVATSDKSADRLRQILQHFDSRISSNKLAGKVCILTGVGNDQGIGWATTVLFAKEGVKHLYLVDLDGKALPVLSDSVTKINPNIGVTTFTGDVTDEELVRSICQQALREHGHLDVVFANAGVPSIAPLKNSNYKTAQRTMHINTDSCWLALKYGTEAMLKNEEDYKGGSIIFTASVAGMRFGGGSVDYSASKAAVMSMAKTGANAYPGCNIRVNAISPGLIKTQMISPIFEAAKDKSKVGQLCSLRRYGVPNEVAAVVLFLAGNDSSYINGAVIPIDGGLSSSHPVVPGREY